MKTQKPIETRDVYLAIAIFCFALVISVAVRLAGI